MKFSPGAESDVTSMSANVVQMSLTLFVYSFRIHYWKRPSPFLSSRKTMNAAIRVADGSDVDVVVGGMDVALADDLVARKPGTTT